MENKVGGSKDIINVDQLTEDTKKDSTGALVNAMKQIEEWKTFSYTNSEELEKISSLILDAVENSDSQKRLLQ